jgi:hypothetical protein
MEEVEDLVAIAKNHPRMIANFSISDTIMKDPVGGMHPLRRIVLELNESMLSELMDRK